MRTEEWLLGLCLCVSVAACAAPAPQAAKGQPEALSLLGQPLYPPELSPEQRARLEENLARARAEYERQPDNPDAVIWLGRRMAYLGRFREAIAIYSEGLKRHPDHPGLLRHRGHRYLTVREIDRAIADLDKAAVVAAGKPDEVEPDGAPNPKNIPRTTLQTNIWYHLGLAHYLRRDFAKARRAFATCLELSKNDDMAVASRYWLYLSLARLGNAAEAQRVLEPVREHMDILENFAYRDLLLLFKGEKSHEALLAAGAEELTRATLLYGMGAWHLVNGRQEQAMAAFREVVPGKLWPAFGHLASEAELAGQQ